MEPREARTPSTVKAISEERELAGLARLCRQCGGAPNLIVGREALGAARNADREASLSDGRDRAIVAGGNVGHAGAVTQGRVRLACAGRLLLGVRGTSDEEAERDHQPTHGVSLHGAIRI